MTKAYVVPLTEIRVGDDVKVDGIGFLPKNGIGIEYAGATWLGVSAVMPDRIGVMALSGLAWFRRSSIIAARRRVENHLCTQGVPACLGDGSYSKPHDGTLHAAFNAGRAAKPEPAKPEPGTWDCSANMVHPGPGFHLPPCRVYRSTGWSKDERTGQPWVPKQGDPILVTVIAEVGAIAGPLEAVVREVEGFRQTMRRHDEPWADYYKRIGLDVRPVERRKAAK